MISALVFITLACIDAILVLYAFVDNKNRIYGNIAAGVGSVILSGYLGTSIQNGNVSEHITTVMSSSTTAVNNTTTYIYTQSINPMTDPALGLLFMGVSVAMTIAVLLLGVEAVKEISEEEFD